MHQLKYKWPAWLISLVSILMGAMTILSFAPFRYYFLMPFLYMALMLIIYFYPKKSVWYTYLWGLGAFIAHCYWINTAINVFGGVPKYISIPLSLLLPIYLALYPMCAVWFSRQFKFSVVTQIVVIIPLAWVVFEYLREHLLTGFGWGTLGYSQAADSPLIGYASLGGILLVTYVVALIGALIFYVIVVPKLRKKLLAFCTIILLILIGQVSKLFDFTQYNKIDTQVGIVQVNIPQDIKFNDEMLATFISSFQQIITQYPKVDILFFPETSIPIPWENLTVQDRKTFMHYAQKYNTSLALGLFKKNKLLNNFYNAVLIIDSKKMQDEDGLDHFPFYAKRHLVPFGEYKPWPLVTNYIMDLFKIPLGELAKGYQHQTAIQVANQIIAFNICYEEGFEDELVEMAKTSTLIANETNMAWYGSSYAMDLQLQQAQARAVELGRYVVRSTNTGYSTIIDNKGKIVSYLPRDQFGVLIGTVKGFTGLTPYMRMGGSFYWILSVFLILLSLLVYSKIFKRQKEN